MNEVTQHLRHRLERNQSLSSELRQSVIYASVPLFIVALGAWGMVTDSVKTPTPRWVWFAAVPFSLATLGFVWNVVVKARRAMSGSAPIVEIDVQPWRPGEPARIRIVDPEAARLESLEVCLVAQSTQVDRVRPKGGGFRVTEAERHRATVLTMTGDELRRQAPLDRVVSAVAPPEAAGQGWRWQILLIGKAGRLPRIDGYPLIVDADTSAAPVPSRR